MPKIEWMNEVIDKAALKKDGVYSHKGNLYAVKNNRVKLVSEWREIYSLHGNFVCKRGECEPHKMKKQLLTMLKDE